MPLSDNFRASLSGLGKVVLFAFLGMLLTCRMLPLFLGCLRTYCGTFDGLDTWILIKDLADTIHSLS